MVEPIWAKPLIEAVLLANGRSKTPHISWRQSRGQYTSGTTYRGRNKYYRRRMRQLGLRNAIKPEIVIRLGSNTLQHRWVLLHELAHWLVRRGHNHDSVFWKKAFELYSIYLTAEEFENCKMSEFRYMKTARFVYDKLYQV